MFPFGNGRVKALGTREAYLLWSSHRVFFLLLLLPRSGKRVSS